MVWRLSWFDPSPSILKLCTFGFSIEALHCTLHFFCLSFNPLWTFNTARPWLCFFRTKNKSRRDHLVWSCSSNDESIVSRFCVCLQKPRNHPTIEDLRGTLWWGFLQFTIMHTSLASLNNYCTKFGLLYNSRNSIPL